jgi:hypothetical protein
MSCLQLKLLEMVARGTAGTRYPLYPVRTGVGQLLQVQALGARNWDSLPISHGTT